MSFRSIVQSMRVVRARMRGTGAPAQVNRFYSNHLPNRSLLQNVEPEIGVCIERSVGFPDQTVDTYFSTGMSRYLLTDLRTHEVCRCEYSLTVANKYKIDFQQILVDVVKVTVANLKALGIGSTYQYSFSELNSDRMFTVGGFLSWSGIWLASDRISMGEVDGVPILLFELVPITAGELHRVNFHLDEFIADTANGQIDLTDLERISPS